MISLSLKRIEPWRGGLRPEIERSVVDLPAPLEPIEGDALALLDLDGHALQRLDVPVEGVDVVDLEQGHQCDSDSPCLPR